MGLPSSNFRSRAARPEPTSTSSTCCWGASFFGWQFNWIKAELDTRLDFDDGDGQLLGTLEAGALLIGRVGLFLRVGTQLAGSREIDYSLVTGLRYLFRLQGGAARPP